MAGRKIQGRLEEIYNVEVPPDLISLATGAALEEARGWQNRPLEKPYAVAYLGAPRVKGKAGGESRMKSVYAALGVNFEGQKEVLGLWIAENEGAKLWTGVLSGLKNRGARDIPAACMGGLTGFP
jgi:transposase-like protein